MKITDSDSFGKAIRERRWQLGLTQSDVADFSNVSISFLSDLENGKKTIELEKAILVAMTLGLDINMTARGDDSEV